MNKNQRLILILLGIGFIGIGTWQLSRNLLYAHPKATKIKHQEMSSFEFHLEDFVERKRGRHGKRTKDSHYELVRTEKFSVHANEHIKVNVPIANVNIREGASSTAIVEVYLTGSNKDEAHDFLKQLDLQIFQQGNTVTVEAASRQWRNWRNENHNSIRLDIQIPTHFNANIHTASGDIQVGSLIGTVTLDTASGDVKARSLKGETVNVRSASGDINIHHVSGNSNIQTASGDLAFETLESPYKINLVTSSGDIRATNLKTKFAELTTSAGDVRLENASGDIQIHTSAGDISVEKLYGTLNAETNAGDISLELIKEAPLQLTSHAGDINIDLPDNMSFNYDLQASELDASFVQRKRNREAYAQHYEGSVGKGGVMVRAKSSLGEISIY